MKKLFLVAMISLLAVSCERAGDLTENSNNENQTFSKRTDSATADESQQPQNFSPAPVDPKDIVPPRH